MLNALLPHNDVDIVFRFFETRDYSLHVVILIETFDGSDPWKEKTLLIYNKRGSFITRRVNERDQFITMSLRNEIGFIENRNSKFRVSRQQSV